MSPAYDQNREDIGEYGAYGLSSLAKKTRTSNHLQMLYQRQHILRSVRFVCDVNVIYKTFPRRSFVFSQSGCEVSASLTDVGGVPVGAVDLINCSRSVPWFIWVFDVSQ